MQSRKPNNQQLLQLIVFFVLVPLAFSTAKPGCPDRCGDLPIHYPFGLGSDCSLDPYFSIHCNTSIVPPKAYLSIINTEVIEINHTYIRIKYPNPVSACYDLSVDVDHPTNATAGQSYKRSMMMNLSGTPYALSEVNTVTIIGCDDAVVLQSNGSGRWRDDGGGCSAFCADKDDTGGVGYCPTDFTTSITNYGCCQAKITRGTTLVEAQLIDLSRKFERKKLFPCSYAFIQEKRSKNETIFSYPLQYLDNARAVVDDDWARAPVVRLDWIAGTDNCTQAKLNSTTYACRDDKSVCVDNYHVGEGYTCNCVEGYQGNPYLLQGCQATSLSNAINVKPRCQDQCGKLSIPYPFGIGPGCYMDPSFEIICNTTTNPPRPYLRVLNAEVTELNSSKVLVNYPNLARTCYNLSDGITKPEKQSLVIDLLGTQYTLSEENWINAIGCDDMVVVDVLTPLRNWSSIRSSCAAICSDGQIQSRYSSLCPHGTVSYSDAAGCCRALIPRGASYVEAALSEVSGRWPRTNFSCSYAFAAHSKNDRSYFSVYNIMSNATDPPYVGPNVLALDWRIGASNCEEARQDPPNFACQANSDCVDIDDDNVRGYLCNCSKGYQGNPYLTHGCQGVEGYGHEETIGEIELCGGEDGEYAPASDNK